MLAAYIICQSFLASELIKSRVVTVRTAFRFSGCGRGGWVVRWDLELAVLFLAWYDWGNRHDLFGGIFGVMAVTSPN